MAIQKITLNSGALNLPTPINISYFWNFGSLLGMCLGLQIITGVLLSLHYTSDISTAFASVNHILRDVNLGWLMRIMHSNGASLFFLCIYLHIGRGVYYGSYMSWKVWSLGVVILFMIMGSAFLGYVLPWGQMSFWGATVITNLFSVVPYIGGDIVIWLWGGFSVDAATLSRFFSFHYILPLLSSVVVVGHMLLLHESGSSNPLGVSSDYYKINFAPYFIYKDLLGAMMLLTLYGVFVFYYPWVLADPENFIPANSLVTPVHIQPEWYFLFAYAILRSIPSKLGGVVALVMSIVILLFLPIMSSKSKIPMIFSPPLKLYFWLLVIMVILLTWIGARPVEGIYIQVGQMLTGLYFLWYLLLGWLQGLWFSLLE
nr:cytochrome b [Pennella sp. (in: crustaceans)]